MKRSIWVLFIVLCFNVSAFSADDSIYIRIYPSDFKATMHDLGNIGHYDIAGVDLKDQSIDLFIPESEFEDFDQRFDTVVLAGPQELKELRVDPDYKDPTEIESIMAQFHADYPNITHLESIGQSFEGRDIWAIKISDNPEIDEDEHVVLFNGQHHAREVMSSEVPLDTIEYLCSEYQNDLQVTFWVNNLEIWVIPQVNVDGTAYVFNSYDMWRKDRHEPPSGSTYYGIDPNRNYPAFWASCDGSDDYPSSDTYHGQFPGESNCVSNMMNFAQSIRPIFDISYHSYSELVIYPYGCSGEYTPEHDIYSQVGQNMAALIERDSGQMGYSPGTCWEVLFYSADGGDTDWYYAELGTYAFVVELNSSSAGFLPDYSLRDSTVQRLRPGWMYLLDRVYGPSVTGHVYDACTGNPLEGAAIAIQEFPLTADETERTSDEFGRFYNPLISGEYHVEASKTGYRTSVVPVNVINNQVIKDIHLIPSGSYGIYLGGFSMDDSSGDGDGYVDPGETLIVDITLRSAGNTTNVYGELSSSDPYVVIDDSMAFFGNITDGGTGSSQAPHFQISIDPGCPEGHEITVNIDITADQTLCLDSDQFSFFVTQAQYQCPVYEETLDVNPGYDIDNSGSNGWEFGQPTVGISGGHTGLNCYGTNLDGDHGNNGDYKLTSTPFDCSNINGAELYFWRYLYNETGYDMAYVQISTDTTNWITIWNGYSEDSQWNEQSFDISEYADGEPQVYIRWRLTSDVYVTEFGFYVDDIKICGRVVPDDPPTPEPTWTQNPQTPTPEFTPTPTSTFTGLPTNTPTSTPTVPTGVPTYTQLPTFTPEPPATHTPQPTYTPQYTYTPEVTQTPTSTPETWPWPLKAEVVLNKSTYTGGDDFVMSIRTTNYNTQDILTEQYLILDVYGVYFFHPFWTETPDSTARTIPGNVCQDVEIFSFVWPEGVGSADGLIFWLGYMNAEQSELISNIAQGEFNYR